MTTSVIVKIHAIVVTFNPELNVLSNQLTLVSQQIEQIWIIDNNSHQSPKDLIEKLKLNANTTLIQLPDNLGLASAQNMGINNARLAGATHVLILDQDSIPAPNMVDKLINAILEQELPAAVGARYFDERQNNPPPFIRINGLQLNRCVCTSDSSVVKVDYLISSGCLIPMEVLDKVGGMRDDFFIDYIDIEWGLRARSMGYQSYGVCSASMQHSLGEYPIKFLGKNIPLHSPLRHYYHFRNAVLLYKESWVSWNWKLVDGWRLCLKYIFYSLFAKPRNQHFYMMSLGIYHGIIGKSGKLHQN